MFSRKRLKHYGIGFVVLIGVVAAVIFSAANDAPPAPAAPRDSAEALVSEAQPVSSLDVQVVGDVSLLNGTIIFLEQRAQPDYRLAAFNFASNELSTVFDIPSGALVYQLSAGITADSLLLTYSTPEMAYAYNGVYQLDLSVDDAAPDLIFGGEESGVYYADPVANPDGRYIYATTYHVDALDQRQIVRYTVATGTLEVIIEQAIMPVLSPDGTQLAYFRIDAETGVRSLWVADADGVNARQISLPDAFPDIDMVRFAATGDVLYFAVLTATTASDDSTAWLPTLLGASTAYAHGNHSVPAYWYQVSLGDESVRQVSRDEMIILNGALSANGAWLGTITDTGFAVVDIATRSSVDVLSSRAMRNLVWLAA